MMQPNDYFQPHVPQGPQQPVGAPVPPIMNQAPPTSYNSTPKHSNGAVFGLVITSLLLVIAVIFGIWSFGQMQDYKLNSDEKVTAAVAVAEKALTEKKNAEFADLQKKDTKTYVGPSSFGTITVQYPKTWSGYVMTGQGSNEPLHAMFHPDIVPSIQSGGIDKPAIALSIKVVNEPYDQAITRIKSTIENEGASATPYALPKMPNQVGLKITGKITEKLNGTQVFLPLRDKTIVITAETDQFANDLEKYILPNITFVP